MPSSLLHALVAIVVTSVVLIGCVPIPILTDSSWEVKSIGGVDVDRSKGKGGLPMFRFIPDSGRVMGYGGCNQFAGPFTQDEKKVTIVPVISTRMVCPSIDIENQLYKAFEMTTSVDRDGELLVFKNGDSVLLECISSPLPLKK